MALNLVGSVISLTAATLAFIVFVAMWIIMPNKNNRKDLLAVTAGVSFILAVQSGYYLTGDHRIQRLDGVWVQWERPIFTGIAGSLLVVAIGLFLAVDYHIYLILLVKIAAAAACWEFGYISGDPANTPRTWVFWFLIGGAILLSNYVIAIWAKKRDKDNLAWVILIFTLVFNIMIATAWIVGPAFLNAFSGALEYWLYVSPATLLYVIPYSQIPDQVLYCGSGSVRGPAGPAQLPPRRRRLDHCQAPWPLL